MATKTTKATIKVPALTPAAKRRGDAKAALPTALVAVKLDELAKAVHLQFRSGLELRIPIAAIPEIANVPLAQLREVQASPLGDGLIFEPLGEGFYVPGLLRDFFGATIGGVDSEAGGRPRSAAGRAPSRKGGRRGGSKTPPNVAA